MMQSDENIALEWKPSMSIWGDTFFANLDQ